VQAGGKPGLSCWYFARLIRTWRCRWYIPPKRRLTFNWLHGVISQKIITLHNHRCKNVNSYL
jgi:hypothetical protein